MRPYFATAPAPLLNVQNLPVFHIWIQIQRLDFGNSDPDPDPT